MTQIKAIPYNCNETIDFKVHFNDEFSNLAAAQKKKKKKKETIMILLIVILLSTFENTQNKVGPFAATSN